MAVNSSATTTPKIPTDAPSLTPVMMLESAERSMTWVKSCPLDAPKDVAASRRSLSVFRTPL